MVKLAKLIRMLFGFQAWMMVSFPVYLWVAVRLYWKLRHTPPHWLPPQNQQLLVPSIVFASLLVMAWYGGIGLTSGLAWWSLKKGWPSARIWALIASLVCLPAGSFFSLIGLAGLVVFWKKPVVSAVADSPTYAPSRKVAGDGTHKYFDVAVEFGMIVVLFYARYWWTMWGISHDLPPSSLPAWLGIALAVHTGVLFHEAGHALVGWKSDMILRGFQLGPFAGQVKDGRWQFTFVPAGLTGGGAVSMVPKHLDRIKGRMVMMALGGPIASLLIGSIATLLALSAHGSPWEPAWGFLAILGTLGLCDFLVNLTPRRPESHYSDGAQIYQIMSNGPWADRHLAMAMVASSIVTPLRPRDFDIAILEKAANSRRDGDDGLYLRMFTAMHYLDNGQIEQGIAAWRQALEQDPAATDRLATDVCAELVFYEAAVAGDLERAQRWWQRVETKGDSRKRVDYWKGRTAILLLEGKSTEAAIAFHQADTFASNLPHAGSGDFDRWCVDLLRSKLSSTDLERISQAISPVAEPQLA